MGAILLKMMIFIKEIACCINIFVSFFVAFALYLHKPYGWPGFAFYLHTLSGRFLSKIEKNDFKF